jgi:hypothetical protein
MVHARGLILAGSAAVLIAGAVAAAARDASAKAPSGPVGGRITWTPNARPTQPGSADWERIRTAAGLRRIALQPHKSAHFRSFTASLGLHQLLGIQPLGPGRCATAVVYLYDNLLDLNDAYEGENWSPLRRAVAKEPSINACAPTHPSRLRP